MRLQAAELYIFLSDISKDSIDREYHHKIFFLLFLLCCLPCRSPLTREYKMAEMQSDIELELKASVTFNLSVKEKDK